MSALIEIVISFLVAVAAGVACHYIIKWLDGDDNDNYPRFVSAVMQKENPRPASRGFSTSGALIEYTAISFCLLAL